MEHDECLSQNEIDELLAALGDVQNKTDKFWAAYKDEKDSNPEKEHTRKVRIYDFKRPDIVSKQAINRLLCINKDFCKVLSSYFQNQLELDITASPKSVDQLTREESVFSILLSFNCSARWLGGILLFSLDSSVLNNGILGRTKADKLRKPVAFERDIFMQYVAKPCLNFFHSILENRSDAPLEDIQEPFFESDETRLPYGEHVREMGVRLTITFKYKNASKDAYKEMYIFLNQQIIEQLVQRNIICSGEKLKVLELEKPVGNVVAEVGRCYLRNGVHLEKNMLLELASGKNDDLAVYVDDKKAWKGTAVCIDDNRGIVLSEQSDQNTTAASDDAFYNTRVLFGWTSSTAEEISGYGEGTVIEFEQMWYEPVHVYKDNVLIATGEVVVADETVYVKIKELKESV